MKYLYSAIKKIAYNGLHLITLGTGITVKINNFKLKLPTKYFRLFPNNYESSSFSFFKKNSTQVTTILDIGAHIGLYSVFFAKTTKGRVFSFEPTPSTVKILRQTININNCDKCITVVESAIAEKPGTATFYSNDIDVSTSNSLLNVDLNDNTNRCGAYQVNVLSIDFFRSQNNLKIDFLKIDAEGVELEALKGAKETFKLDRPFAILGLHPFAYSNRKETLSEIWELLIDYNLLIQIEGKSINKEKFCNNEGMVFDVELLPK